MRAAACWVVVSVLAMTACGKDSSTTSPTDTSTSATSTTDAPPVTTEAFEGVIGVGATTSYPFVVAASGTVTVTLVEIGGTGVPSTVQVRVGIGTMDDNGCTTTVSSVVNITGAAISASEAPGSYCASVTDVGNLFATATFKVLITHP